MSEDINKDAQKIGFEINLWDYLSIIVSRKKIIVAIFLLVTLLTAVVSLFVPPRYEASMVIEQGIMDIDSTGKISYLDSLQNVTAKIKTSAFDFDIIKELDLYPKIKKLRFVVSEPRGSNIIRIAMVQKKKRMEVCLRILDALFAKLSNEYRYIVESKSTGIDKEVLVLTNAINRNKDEIALQEETMKILKVRQEEMVKEISAVRANTEKIITKRDSLTGADAGSGAMAALLYSNTTQQNIAYLNALENQFSAQQTAIENMLTTIKNLNTAINDLQISIEKLYIQKSYIKNMRLVQKPEISFLPIKFKFSTNVIMGSLAGLLLGVMYAFYIEYSKK